MPVKTVLIADDEPILLEIWVEAIGTLSHRVYTATCGIDAIAILKETPIDLLLTDLKMPGSDGISIMEYVKENNLKTKMMVCSGFVDFEERLKLYDLTRVIPKPFNLIEELEQIELALTD